MSSNEDRFRAVTQRVKDAHDLVQVVEGYLPLRRRGRSMVALCPFHEEKSPSFTVYADSQHFKCYGCGKAGDVFTFVMEREGLGFREALEMLAERAGISTEGVFGGPRSSRDERKRADAPAVLAAVRDFFAANLQTPDGAAGLQYLVERGLDGAIEPFGLGFHPTQRGKLRAFAKEKELSLEVLAAAGLLTDDGYEAFLGRVMFPIEDERGRVVGFGGRRLDPGPRKYLNSPESPFFFKHRVLYGLRHVKTAGQRRVVVMEGYTDVLAAHLAGEQGAVASLGTAFTTDHAKILQRYATDGVVLVFDGDRAGRAAAEKAFGELVKTELDVRIALLDEGSDPADLVAPRPDLDEDEIEAGRVYFAEQLDGAQDALSVWIRLKREQFDLKNHAHIAKVVADCARVLVNVDDPARHQVLTERMARHLGLEPEAFRRSAAKRQPRRAVARANASGAAEASGQGGAPDAELEAMAGAWSDEDAERAGSASPESAGSAGPSRRAGPKRLPAGPSVDLDLLACVLAQPDLIGNLSGFRWETPQAELLATAVADAVAAGATSRDDAMRRMPPLHDNREAMDLLTDAVDRSHHIKDPADSCAQVLEHRRSTDSRREAQQLRFSIEEARAQGDQQRVTELTRQYLDCLRGQ